MKIVIAPNALKGSLSAVRAAAAIAQGVSREFPTAELVRLPVADGGDGLIEVLRDKMQAREISISATGPLGSPIQTSYFYSERERRAVIEMAAVAGLALLPREQQNPMLTTTRGVGELIKAALDQGARHLIIGVGGSATNDAGIGMASALGARFYDGEGQMVEPVGASLNAIQAIDITHIDPRLVAVNVEAVCDVQNVLYGEHGAAHVFAAQKGATSEQIEILDRGLKNIARVIQKDLGLDVHTLVGGGAAGGLGAGLYAFLHARLRRGAEVVLDAVGFDAALKGADLVITAEGKLDAQTGFGKAPAGVARRARLRHVPCVVLAGSVELAPENLTELGFASAFCICPAPVSLQTAMDHAADYLANTAQLLMRCHKTVLDACNHSFIKTPLETGMMIRKCLFPAAGYGTRFLPATKAMPKEILPILNKPLIQYGVEEALEAGLQQIAIVTGRGKRALEDHFDISYELEHQISGTEKETQLKEIRTIIDRCTFSYTRQIEMKGLGHAILTGETLIGNEPFGVILADDLCVGEGLGVMSQMLKIYEKYRCSVLAIQEVEHSEVHKYGIIDGRRLDDGIYMISNMVEKPDPRDAPSNLAIIGRYILTPDIFEILRRTEPGKNGELQITDALQSQAREGMVLAYQFRGKRFDCGSIDGFVEATNYFYQNKAST